MWMKLRVAGYDADGILSLFSITRPAVDVEDIARKMGIHVHSVPDPGWSGAVVAKNNDAVIWLDLKDSLQRRRFTIAHEIGHLMLHPLGVAYRDMAFDGTPEEKQANAFAANLLMPWWMFGPYASQSRLTEERAAELASIFDVSLNACNMRLREMYMLNNEGLNWQATE